MPPLCDSGRHNKSSVFQASHSGDLIPFAWDWFKGWPWGSVLAKETWENVTKRCQERFLCFKKRGRRHTGKDKINQIKTPFLSYWLLLGPPVKPGTEGAILSPSGEMPTPWGWQSWVLERTWVLDDIMEPLNSSALEFLLLDEFSLWFRPVKSELNTFFC